MIKAAHPHTIAIADLLGKTSVRAVGKALVDKPGLVSFAEVMDQPPVAVPDVAAALSEAKIAPKVDGAEAGIPILPPDSVVQMVVPPVMDALAPGERTTAPDPASGSDLIPAPDPKTAVLPLVSDGATPRPTVQPAQETHPPTRMEMPDAPQTALWPVHEIAPGVEGDETGTKVETRPNIGRERQEKVPKLAKTDHRPLHRDAAARHDSLPVPEPSAQPVQNPKKPNVEETPIVDNHDVAVIPTQTTAMQPTLPRPVLLEPNARKTQTDATVPVIAAHTDPTTNTARPDRVVFPAQMPTNAPPALTPPSQDTVRSKIESAAQASQIPSKQLDRAAARGPKNPGQNDLAMNPRLAKNPVATTLPAQTRVGTEVSQLHPVSNDFKPVAALALHAIPAQEDQVSLEHPSLQTSKVSDAAHQPKGQIRTMIAPKDGAAIKASVSVPPVPVADVVAEPARKQTPMLDAIVPDVISRPAPTGQQAPVPAPRAAVETPTLRVKITPPPAPLHAASNAGPKLPSTRPDRASTDTIIAAQPEPVKKTAAIPAMTRIWQSQVHALSEKGVQASAVKPGILAFPTTKPLAQVSPALAETKDILPPRGKETVATNVGSGVQDRAAPIVSGSAPHPSVKPDFPPPNDHRIAVETRTFHLRAPVKAPQKATIEPNAIKIPTPEPAQLLTHPVSPQTVIPTVRMPEQGLDRDHSPPQDQTISPIVAQSDTPQNAAKPALPSELARPTVTAPIPNQTAISMMPYVPQTVAGPISRDVPHPSADPVRPAIRTFAALDTSVTVASIQETVRLWQAATFAPFIPEKAPTSETGIGQAAQNAVVNRVMATNRSDLKNATRFSPETVISHDKSGPPLPPKPELRKPSPTPAPAPKMAENAADLPAPTPQPDRPTDAFGSQMPLASHDIKNPQPTSFAGLEKPTPQILSTEHTLHALAKSVSVTAKLGSHTAAEGVELTLNPVELGRVRIALIGTNDQLQISVSVERPETLKLFHQNAEQLRNEFRDAGVDARSFTFNQWGGGGDARQGPVLAHIDPETDQPLDTVDQETLPQRPTVSDSGLDLRL